MAHRWGPRMALKCLGNLTGGSILVIAVGALLGTLEGLQLSTFVGLRLGAVDGGWISRMASKCSGILTIPY
jgi:hypothetical protein